MNPNERTPPSSDFISTDAIGKKAALLSVIEIGLGSLVHAFKIPGGGHVLSLNQGFILTRASIELGDRRGAGLISTTAALLKSLSPAGQKLTPMLAIATQGQLFSLGMWIGGNNRFGHIIGMSLLSLWGYIQPLSIYLVIFGRQLVSMADFYLKEVNQFIPVGVENVVELLALLVAIKILLGIGVVMAAHRMNTTALMKYEAWAKRKRTSQNDGAALTKGHPSQIAQENGAAGANSSPPPITPYFGALKDMLNPYFLGSLALMIFFFVFSQSERAGLIWLILRPVALGYLAFLAIRIFPVERLAKKLERKNPHLSQSLQSALKYIRKI